MRLRYTRNGAIVVVDNAFGQRLLDSGTWEEVAATPEPDDKTEPDKTEPPKPKRRARRTSAPEKEQSTQE